MIADVVGWRLIAIRGSHAAADGENAAPLAATAFVDSASAGTVAAIVVGLGPFPHRADAGSLAPFIAGL